VLTFHTSAILADDISRRLFCLPFLARFPNRAVSRSGAFHVREGGCTGPGTECFVQDTQGERESNSSCLAHRRLHRLERKFGRRKKL